MSDMYEMTDDDGGMTGQPNAGAPEADEPMTTEREKALVKRIIKDIKRDKEHHKKAFDRMRRDMHVAMHGAEKEWDDSKYRANIAGRHVKRKTSALYAKNPKTIARRRETMDFQIWDETPQSLQIAQQLATAQQHLAANPPPPAIDAATGTIIEQPIPMLPGAEQALALLQDVQEGMKIRQFVKKYGETLTLLDEYMLDQQTPLNFKRGMKQVVRRTSVTGVGYVELNFQRELGPRPTTSAQLADARERLDHLKRLANEVSEGEISDTAAEMAELEASVASLQTEPEIVLHEGLVIDYPASTSVIPDRMCKYLEGWIGARHLTLEYDYTVEQVDEMFGVDVSSSFTAYSQEKGSGRIVANDEGDVSTDAGSDDCDKKRNDIVRVWKHYDRISNLVYYVADGHENFLRPPAAPDVFVENFFPVFALTFNEIESEDELFPPSDVTLLLDAQKEINKSRQGMREHRQASRPRWVYANGAIGSEQDLEKLSGLNAFETVALNIDPGSKIGDVLQIPPVPGVDPNLYETNQFLSDIQLVTGAQEAQYGATSDATATQSAIAANSTSASESDATDDIDGFLTRLARARSQIYQREMSADQVLKIVGRGAVWPDVPMADITNEIYLDIEAGSSGRPNQAVEINNWKQMLPMLVQIPGINPLWLAKETVRRLDDRVDLTEAVSEGIMSIVAQNALAQANGMVGGDPTSDPNAQGPKGADNGKKPEQQPGSDAPMGTNQTAPPEQQAGPALM